MFFYAFCCGVGPGLFFVILCSFATAFFGRFQHIWVCIVVSVDVVVCCCLRTEYELTVSYGIALSNKQTN